MKRSRVEFTKPMKKTHTILIPSMLDFHFPLLKYAFLSGGYKCDVIGVNEYSRSQMINAGWEYSNNDVCFPCNLIIGQFICALKSGKYDTAKTAHTISTCGYLDKPEGGQAFVYYGLGNFISTMYDTKSLVGLIGKLNVVKDPDTNEVTFENVKAIPIISHFEGDSYYGDWYNCTVYPYADYTDELFAQNYVEGFTRESVQQCLSYIPDEFLSIE